MPRHIIIPWRGISLLTLCIFHSSPPHFSFPLVGISFLTLCFFHSHWWVFHSLPLGFFIPFGIYFIPYPSHFSFLLVGISFLTLGFFHSPWWAFHSLPLAFFIPLGRYFIPYPLHFSFLLVGISFLPFVFFIPPLHIFHSLPSAFFIPFGGISFLTLCSFHSLGGYFIPLGQYFIPLTKYFSFSLEVTSFLTLPIFHSSSRVLSFLFWHVIYTFNWTLNVYLLYVFIPMTSRSNAVALSCLIMCSLIAELP